MGSIDYPLNDSRGCGGIMRVAPVALYYQPAGDGDRKVIDATAAEVAAITHGGPLGWLPAAILCHVVSVGVYGENAMTLREAAVEAWVTARRRYAGTVGDIYLNRLGALIGNAS